MVVFYTVNDLLKLKYNKTGNVHITLRRVHEIIVAVEKQ